MRQYEDFERQQMEIVKQQQKIDTECVRCPGCGSSWFEEISVHKFQANHNVILGQNVPTKPAAIPYYILKCIRCKDLLEPRIIHNTRDIGGNDYDDFLDTLEGKGDTRKVKDDKVAQLNEVIKGLQERIEILEGRTIIAKPKKGRKQVVQIDCEKQ